MLLYHGTANLDAIRREGLRVNSSAKTDFGEGNRLRSLGGIYMTDSIEHAAFYAALSSGSEDSLGQNPAALELEIEPASLIADEDKVLPLIEREIARLAKGTELEGIGRIDYWSLEDLDEIMQGIDLDGDALADFINGTFRLSRSDKIDAAQAEAIARAVIARSCCYEWEPDNAHTDEVGVLNNLCRRATPTTLDRSWLSCHFPGLDMTCRTAQDIPPGAIVGNRIVGTLELLMGQQGLQVENFRVEGTMSIGDVEEFQTQFIDAVDRITGAHVCPCPIYERSLG